LSASLVLHAQSKKEKNNLMQQTSGRIQQLCNMGNQAGILSINLLLPNTLNLMLENKSI
jgi:hypothetical protein